MAQVPWHNARIKSPPAWLKLDVYDKGTQGWTTRQWVNAVRQRVFWSTYNPVGGLERIKTDPLYIADRKDEQPMRPLTLGDVIESASEPYFCAAARVHTALHKLKGLAAYAAREKATPELSSRYPSNFPHAYLRIDIRAPLAEIRKGFGNWLEQTRLGRATTAKLDPEKWRRHRVLAYADLILWQRHEAPTVSDTTIAHWLAPAEVRKPIENPELWLRRQVKPLYEAVFQSNAIWK